VGGIEKKKKGYKKKAEPVHQETRKNNDGGGEKDKSTHGRSGGEAWGGKMLTERKTQRQDSRGNHSKTLHLGIGVACLLTTGVGSRK